MTADLKYFEGAFWLYVVSGILYIVNFIVSRETRGRLAVAGPATAAADHAPAWPSKIALAATVAALAGVIVHLIAIGMRWAIVQHAPMSNMFESLSFFAMCIVIAQLLIERKFQARSLGAFVMPVVFGIMVFADSVIPEVVNKDLVPALKSYWLTLHVSLAFVGESGFAIGFAASLMYLVAEWLEKRGVGKALLDRMPGVAALDEISYVAIAVGFPIYTSGALIFGAIWAYQAWGTYWSWDPKEVWSLITWLVYAVYLHARLMMRWKGRATAWMSVIGFAATMFCYIGVNYLLSGLHSYASPGNAMLETVKSYFVG